ncbi:nuclear transport factor 2 family protein [Phenylobacterium montanum]|uniref:Nuclear transport factor 2 family protein n=1 Tax=Phenylobacterium montanum TaxID=2823693 RepID=A0A975G1U9_9CAUL|nr:nuclear transport factor 2 family protein [Caulobacter sp. S6]QUD89335.1 nuclear transport factor 2 family protein [Caulobacter sp. S6]
MSDADGIAALAKRFFDAVEAGDIDTVYGSYAPNARIWHNTDGLEQTREENAATLKDFVRRIPTRVYADRRLKVFEGGFVHQHELRCVRADGEAVSLTACIVCAVEDGHITRLDEYFDSAQVAAFRRPAA